MAQTKKQIMSLLSGAGVVPRYLLGQNFLIDKNLIGMLVETASPQKQDVVLEVGSGTGSLTQELTARAGRVIAVEIDPKLAQITRGAVRRRARVRLIVGDVLDKGRFNPAVAEKVRRALSVLKGRFLLVSNLPYGAASPLLIELAVGRPGPDAMFFTVQREVAERLTAKPGTRQYGFLSILIQAIGEFRVIRHLPPQAFWPVPQVESTMLAWRRFTLAPLAESQIITLRKLLTLMFTHRRKKISSCLRWVGSDLARKNWPAAFEAAGISLDLRPEAVPVADWVKVVGGNGTTNNTNIREEGG